MNESIQKLSDFSNVCRICLEKRGKLISIFTELLHFEEKSYREILKECVSVNIEKDDSLPKNLCLKCSKKLEQSYELKIQCLSSEKTLEGWVENIRNEVEIENDQTLCDPLQNEILDNGFEFSDDNAEHGLNDDGLEQVKKDKIEDSKNCKNDNLEPVKKDKTEDSKNCIEVPDKDDGFLCPHCGKIYTSSQELNSHIRTHTGEKPFQCEICDMKFHDLRNLNLHKNKHSVVKKFKCDVCSETYKYPSSLYMHKVSHHSGRKFPCTYCNKVYSNNKSLRNHKLTHTGKQVSKWNKACTYCNKLFNKTSNLKIHLRTHTGEKPFICNKCGRGFSTKHVMNTHMKTCYIKNNL